MTAGSAGASTTGAASATGGPTPTASPAACPSSSTPSASWACGPASGSSPRWSTPTATSTASTPTGCLHYPGRRRDTLRHQLVLNYGRADVREWAIGWLSGLVSEYGLDYFKWDMNRSFTQAGWPDAGSGPTCSGSSTHRGVYAVLDTLRERHPGLRIESCSGGGGRVDFGILRRTDEVWTSDNTDARDRQAIQEGYSYLYPACAMSAWVTDSPNPHTRREVPLAYRFHVAMAA
ncbi:alpha-galactosidase, partial [Nonomuraea dietziae]|uniref:alpha-galactosidase n=1 Tax=Nonomuraea dietziae TaxID=65515 RepID=UPI003CD08A1F